MIIKVCGILDQTNHDALSDLELDMIGINFYEPSKRYIDKQRLEQKINQKRVGVFVNADLSLIASAVQEHHLDYVQLHGDENKDFCRAAQQIASVIKVFRITEEFDWHQIKGYEGVAYFLFDTYTKAYGGSGKRFDWDSLDKYKGTVPFLLAGGIKPADVTAIQDIDHPFFAGIDINSGFEDRPGYKNINKVRSFVKALKSE